LCEVSDDAEIDMTGTLRVGTTTDRPFLTVNSTSFPVGELFEIWSAPLREIYP
jgi:hypothetical protein